MRTISLSPDDDEAQEIISSLMGRNKKPDVPRPQAEAQIMDLVSVLTDYEKAGARFKVGDIVTPKKLSPLEGVGEPHVVMEALSPEQLDFSAGGDANVSSPGFRNKVDIRVAAYSKDNEHVMMWWGESWMYELYEKIE